jgi:hypothetical protein
MLIENDIEVSAEEKEADEQGLAEVKADEVRTKLAEEMGIDPELESDLLDKLVKRDLEQRERLSKTIKQKITWRDKAKGTSKKPEGDKPKDGKKPDEKPDVDALVAEKVATALAERDLKALDLPEAVENEVREIAQVRGISIGEATKLPYIQSRIEEVKAEQRVIEGTPKRNNKGTFKANIDLTKPLDPDDFDLNSEEGRKAWTDAKEAKRKMEKNK